MSQKKKELSFDERLYRYLQRELRRTFRNSPLKTAAWAQWRAKDRGYYYCYVCRKPFKRCDLRIDHILPVVKPEFCQNFGHLGRVLFFSRMFCKLTNLAPICIPDHKVKTAQERKAIREWKARSSSGSGN